MMSLSLEPRNPLFSPQYLMSFLVENCPLYLRHKGITNSTSLEEHANFLANEMHEIFYSTVEAQSRVEPELTFEKRVGWVNQVWSIAEETALHEVLGPIDAKQMEIEDEMEMTELQTELDLQDEDETDEDETD